MPYTSMYQQRYVDVHSMSVSQSLFLYNPYIILLRLYQVPIMYRSSIVQQSPS